MRDTDAAPDNASTTFSVPLVLGFVLIAYVCFLWLMPEDCFWITDGGNKFIQLKSFSESGSIAVVYPAEDIDPQRRFFPRGGHHFKSINGKMYSFYPPYFSLISAPLYNLFGWNGIFIIPLFSTIACLFFVSKMARFLRLPKERILLILSAFATPLFFYSLTFWEHTLAVLLSTASVYLALLALSGTRPGLFLSLAGGLIGAAAAFREESYVLLAAMAGALMVCSNHKRSSSLFALALGFLSAALPLWIFNYLTYGHILGLHPVIYSELPGGPPLLSLQAVIMKISNFFVYLFRFHAAGADEKFLTTLLVIPFILATAAGVFTKKDDRYIFNVKVLILAICSFSSLALTTLLIKNPKPIINTLWTQSLVTSIPFIIIFFINIGNLMTNPSSGIKFLTATSLFYIVATCLCLNQRDMGVIWSARHYLSIIPVLTVISWFSFLNMLNFAKSKKVRIAFLSFMGLLAFSSIIIQGHGVKTLSLKKHASEKLIQAASHVTTDIIVTDIFWLPAELASLYYSKKILQIGSDSNIPALLELYSKNNIQEYTFALSANPHYRRISNNALRRMLEPVSITPTSNVSVSGAEFMMVQFFQCRSKA